MPQNHDQLIDEILEFIWQENPVEATMAGIHRYDDRLERCDLVSRRNKLRRKKEYVQKIEVLQKADNSSDELDLLCCALRVGVFTEEHLHSLDRDPGIYPRLIIYGIYQLIARSAEPYHYRALRAIERMREAPRLLSEGRLNLSYADRVPQLWSRAAIDFMIAGRQYLEQLTAMLAEEVPELGEVLKKYSAQTLEAFDRYLDFLLDEVSPSAGGSFGVGEEILGFLIHHEHKLFETSVEDLREMAREEIVLAEKELEKAAAEIPGEGGWRGKLLRVDRETAAVDLRAYWEELVAEVREKADAAALVTLPEAESLRVVETPPFERPTIPVAGYIPAAPMEDNSRAFFCVTPASVEPEEKDEAASRMKWHSRPRAMLHVLREIYPGRHTLLSHRRQANARLAYLTCHNLLEDGWCVYAVDRMIEAGAVRDPNLRLLAAHEKLVAAWRVLVDVSLHAGGMDEHQAVRELSARTGMSDSEAMFEVRRLAINPTSSLGAMVGRRQIETLRRECEQAARNGFSPGRFHDALLRLSALPVSRISNKIMNELEPERIR